MLLLFCNFIFPLKIFNPTKAVLEVVCMTRYHSPYNWHLQWLIIVLGHSKSNQNIKLIELTGQILSHWNFYIQIIWDSSQYSFCLLLRGLIKDANRIRGGNHFRKYCPDWMFVLMFSVQLFLLRVVAFRGLFRIFWTHVASNNEALRNAI